GGEPPRLHHSGRAFIGGIDPRAGGTWLGVNDCGMLVAITNRQDRAVPPQARSRGLPVRDLPNASSAAEALQVASAQLMRGCYGGCNIVLLDGQSGHVVSARESIRSESIQPGIHAVTSGNVDDRNDPRIAYALCKLAITDLSSAEDSARALRAICAENAPDGPPMCLHGQEGGTVSSTVIILRAPVFGSEIWHCQGSPDRQPYVNCSDLFCELNQTRRRAVR